MDEYKAEIKSTLLKMLAWGIFICGSAYGAGQEWRIPGLVMGIASSMIYCILLWYRILKSVDMPLYKAVFYMRLGWGIRLFFIVVMLFLSLRIPALDFVSAVIGLFTLQMVMVSHAFLFVVKNFLNK